MRLELNRSSILRSPNANKVNAFFENLTFVAFLSGEHDLKDLSRLAQKFIQEVVLCPQCGLPEITIEIASKKILGVCRACGGREELKISNEKFRRFVLNHPPTSSKGAFDGKQDVKK